MSAVLLTAKHAKTANKKGSVPSSSRELKNGVSSPWEKKTGEPSRVWVWISTGGLKRSVRCNLAKTANKKGSVPRKTAHFVAVAWSVSSAEE